MGTCSETICMHRILFPSIQHLAWLPQGRPQGKPKCGKNTNFWLTHWHKHRITRKLLKIDRYMLQEVWQALNCLSIHATYCVIIAGASPGETKMWAAAGSILSVESNQNVESKTKNVESKTGKCGVQNSILTARNQLFWALTHLIQYNLHSSSFQTLHCFCTKFG